MNQTEKSELKQKFTDVVKAEVEKLYGGTADVPVSVRTVKGFALEVEGEYVEVSCVVKKAPFDVNDAHQEYLDKVQAKADREADRKAKAEKREADKKAKAEKKA